jgi:hypothetical protein
MNQLTKAVVALALPPPPKKKVWMPCDLDHFALCAQDTVEFFFCDGTDNFCALL